MDRPRNRSTTKERVDPGSELDDIVGKHERWVASSEKAGSYATLVGSDVNGANLPDAVLADAQLNGVNLTDAMLGGANLRGDIAPDLLAALKSFHRRDDQHEGQRRKGSHAGMRHQPQHLRPLPGFPLDRCG